MSTYSSETRWLSFPLLAWLHVSPDNLHSWYRLSRMQDSLSHMRIDCNCLYYLWREMIRNKCKYTFMFLGMNQAHQVYSNSGTPVMISCQGYCVNRRLLSHKPAKRVMCLITEGYQNIGRYSLHGWPTLHITRITAKWTYFVYLHNPYSNSSSAHINSKSCFMINICTVAFCHI